jgi:hypothetical protein
MVGSSADVIWRTSSWSGNTDCVEVACCPRSELRGDRGAVNGGD